MNFIRMIAFNIAFYGGSLFWSLVLQWLRFTSRETAVDILRKTYFAYVRWITDNILCLKLELRGLEHLPKTGAYILAAKHQSAYETLLLPSIVPDSAIILKEELTRIPLWGFYPKKMGMIAIDRGSAKEAMASIVEGAKRVRDEGRPIIIFPQGTRVAPGAQAPYKIGLAKVYRDVPLQVVPMALNAGVFWGRNSFTKKPGTVVFEFMPPLPADMPPRQMMKQLEDQLEAASEKLLKEAQL